MTAPSPPTPSRTDRRLLDRLIDGEPFSPVDPVRIELDNLRSAHRALRAMTLRMQVLVQIGLLAATVFTPLLRIGGAARSDAIAAAAVLVRMSPSALGDPGTHPLALPGGLALVRVGLALVLAGVLFGVLGSRPMTRVPLRTAGAVMASLTAFALVLGAALLIAGAALVPEHRIVVAFGVVFPIGAGVWLWHGARSLRQLDWDWTDGGDGPDGR